MGRSAVQFLLTLLLKYCKSGYLCRRGHFIAHMKALNTGYILVASGANFGAEKDDLQLHAENMLFFDRVPGFR